MRVGGLFGFGRWSRAMTIKWGRMYWFCSPYRLIRSLASDLDPPAAHGRKLRSNIPKPGHDLATCSVRLTSTLSPFSQQWVVEGS